MPRLIWSETGERIYETGVDRGVLYVDGQPSVPWIGLISIVEKPSGGSQRAFYIDGVKYLNIPSADEFEATINAFTYPDEFAHCEGTTRIHSGLFVTQQPKKSFGLSYRTKIGNSLTSDYGYKIHIVYNAIASTSQRTYKTLNDLADPTDFSWDITTRPPAMTGYKSTAHLIVDSRYTNPATISAVEDILYGTDSYAARLPSLAELVDIFEANSILSVKDHGDGTFTVSGPVEALQMLDSNTFKITWPSAVVIDDNSYTISSL